ncbi:MAG: PQQ-binding-like beta-propeller repeat protein, partial [Planctomycetales bacterium]
MNSCTDWVDTLSAQQEIKDRSSARTPSLTTRFTVAARYLVLLIVAIGAGCSTTIEPAARAEPRRAATVASWPWWLGPNSNAVAQGAAPNHWSETENVVWRTPVPGRGYSSPIVVGGDIFLTTADDEAQIQSVL